MRTGGRRRFLQVVTLGLLSASLARTAKSEEENPAKDERPQRGDLLVYAEDDKKQNQIIRPDDLKLNEQPIMAWPFDPVAKVARDGSRLNQVLLVRLAPDSLDETTQEHAADGIVAYSAVCAHEGCPVTGWIEDQGKQVLKCFCHNSEYDPRQGALVVFGPAPRPLAALPVKIDNGKLLVAGKFIGKVGLQQTF